MELFINCLFVGLGGMFGAVCRYLLGLLPVKPQNSFPLITFCINAIGAFLIGAIVALSVRHTSVNPRLILFLKVGFCGGFTTFSTFALESAGLLTDGHGFVSLCYILLSVTVCILAVWAGQALLR